MTKGAEDDVSLCVLSGVESYRQQKRADDHDLSPRAIRPDCLWIVQKGRGTIRFPRMSSDPPSLDDKR